MGTPMDEKERGVLIAELRHAERPLCDMAANEIERLAKENNFLQLQLNAIRDLWAERDAATHQDPSKWAHTLPQSNAEPVRPAWVEPDENTEGKYVLCVETPAQVEMFETGAKHFADALAKAINEHVKLYTTPPRPDAEPAVEMDWSLSEPAKRQLEEIERATILPGDARLNNVVGPRLADAEPVGWKLVPIEPTPAMLQRGDQGQTPGYIWEAMLSAAPAPPRPDASDPRYVISEVEGRFFVQRAGTDTVVAEFTDPPRPDASAGMIEAAELNDILTTLKHARVFITSREKMHPTGVELYDELIERLRARAADAEPVALDPVFWEACECLAEWADMPNVTNYAFSIYKRTMEILPKFKAVLDAAPPRPDASAADYDRAWEAIAASDELGNARRRLSIYELRLIIRAALTGSSCAANRSANND